VRADEVTVLKAARLFDARSANEIKNGVVIVEGGKIKAVGSGLTVPAGAHVVDLGDATLLPGFIDAHTHLTSQLEDDWYRATVDDLRRTVPEHALRAAEFARRTLHAGFTTVRDVGSQDFIDVGLRNAIEAGYVPGPRMLVSVNALGARGGHCDQGGFPYMKFGKETGIADGIAAGPDGFRDAVRFQVKYGADVIKVCATGGVLSLTDDVDTPQVTQAEMNALVEEAHRLRRKTAAHAHGKEGARVAISAGIDSIEHGSFLDKDTLQMMKDRGTWLVPTCLAVDTTVGTGDAKRSYPPAIDAKARAAGAAHDKMLRMAIQMGVKIALGTDAGVYAHGKNAHEFSRLVDHGMTPAQALRAGTANASVLLGVDKQIGTLEPGKDADIVAVVGDPLTDIKATENVRMVMRMGKIVKNETCEKATQ
jgi:imidazolonepropionase-like amidohydrolase